jgi:hypothetical protein
MYLEVSCPSRLLYSIYTGREAQCNTNNNYTQSILPTLFLLSIIISRYALGAVETFLDAAPSAGFFQGALLFRILICFICLFLSFLFSFLLIFFVGTFCVSLAYPTFSGLKGFVVLVFCRECNSGQ